MLHAVRIVVAVAFAAWLGAGASLAADVLKVAIGQREIWHGSVASLGLSLLQGLRKSG